MKKLCLLFILISSLPVAGFAAAEGAVPIGEAVVYVDHGCADDDKLDQCIRIDWIKDQTFTWQWYQGETKKNKSIASVDKNEILETLAEIFDEGDIDEKALGASLKDKKAVKKWFHGFLTANPEELLKLLALDSVKISIKADSACKEKSILNCPSRRVEFTRIGVGPVETADGEAGEEVDDEVISTQPLAAGSESETSTETTASSSTGSWILSILLLLLAGGVGVLGYFVRNLLKQSGQQQSTLNDLSAFTLDNLRNISRALGADESKQSAEITAKLKGSRKDLVTDADRLAPVFSEILAPAVKNISSARLYLSIQEKLFRSTQNEEARANIVNETREHLGELLPDAANASTLEDMKGLLDKHEKEQSKRRQSSEDQLREKVDQLLNDQEQLTAQTQMAFTNLQQTISRLDSVVKTNAEKHLFELTRSMPKKLGVLKTNLNELTIRTEKDQQKLEGSMLQSLQQFEEKMAENFSAVAERVESIFRNAGSSHTIADAAKSLKAYRIIEAAKEAPAKLSELESIPAVTMMSGAARWISLISEGYQNLHEPVAQGDSISRYCAYVLDSAGLKDTLADFDASFFDRLGLASSVDDTEEFIRLWGNPKERAVHSDLFKLQFLLENMLCPLLQDQQEHPVLTIRDQIVPFCESIAGSARMVGVQLHRVGPQTDQNVCRWFMDPCGESGRMTQAILNSKIEFVEIFKEWLKTVNNNDTESGANMAIEICQLGYTFTGKSRPEAMTRVVCYKDVAWQLN